MVNRLMDFDHILFGFFALLAVASAILMITRRNIVHSAVFLITALLATAGIFLQLQAEFLFVTQIILYVGGIMVLFVFVIMLVNLDVSMRQVQFNHQKWVAIILAAVLGAQFFFALWLGRSALRLPARADVLPLKNTEAVGQALFQRYMLPFEIASILLLVAMIGAVVMAKRRV
jgi:NADH-quinone oxidoreductase subunit J